MTVLRTPGWHRALTLTLTLILAVTIGAQAPASAAARKRIAAPKPVPSVPGSYGKPASLTATANQFTRPPASVRWPAPTAADVSLPTAGGPGATAEAKASGWTVVPGTPVRLGAAPAGGPATSRHQAGLAARSPCTDVLDHAAGGEGRPVVVRLTRTDATPATGGSVRFGLDYTAFKEAYGGDWAERLRLVSLPECALRTPAASGCQALDLFSSNDTTTGMISATVGLAGTTGDAATTVTADARASVLVALASSPQTTNGGGDYAATPTSPTSSWTAGGQSGTFAWSYPIKTPPAIGGPTPNVGIGYDSAAMDGLTAASNNQPSWAGDGFDYNPGFVTRTYVACADDGKSGVGDLCWGTDNATLTLPGHSGELLQVSTNPDLWKLRNDDGTKVERRLGAVNGARNGEFWEVTTPDGWVYSFGLNQLPGWSTGKTTTQSVFAVPVFGNNVNEPCYNATYANASCDQAWTWNLDYVLDPRGNSMSLWYAPEYNHYGRNATGSTVSTYVRGGHIDHIAYGTRKNSGVESFYSTGFAPAQVVFGAADRCETAGPTCVQGTPANWPDVPWDQQCDSTTSCPNVLSPAFFTQQAVRLGDDGDLVRNRHHVPRRRTMDAHAELQDSRRRPAEAALAGQYPTLRPGKRPSDRPAGRDVHSGVHEQPRRHRPDQEPHHAPAALVAHHRRRRRDLRHLLRSGLRQGLADARVGGQQHVAVLPGLLDAVRHHDRDVRLLPQVRGHRGRRHGPDRQHRAEARQRDVLPVPGQPGLALRRQRTRPAGPQVVGTVARLRQGPDDRRRCRHGAGPDRHRVLPRHARRQDRHRHAYRATRGRPGLRRCCDQRRGVARRPGPGGRSATTVSATRLPSSPRL